MAGGSTHWLYWPMPGTTSAMWPGWYWHGVVPWQASSNPTRAIRAAVVALFFAYRRIWRPVAACEPGQVCALPQVNRSYKALFWIVVGLVLVALGFSLVAPWFY